ncbi:MAG: YjjG family noncanonical pyrimidine nucleotidase [Flavobacteriales bacterium]
MDNIRHIFFDLDNTLWDFDSNSRETLGEVYDQFQLHDKADADKTYFIERYLIHNDHYWDLYRQNRVTKARLRTARFEKAMEDVGIYNKKLSRHFGQAYIEQCPHKTKLNDDVLEVLEKLSGNYRLHILSNGFHEVQLVKLKVSGLEPFFDQVVTSELARAKKPSPRIFEYAQKVSGASEGESLMIGDHLDADVVGALEFGWKAIHYNPKALRHQHQSISRLKDLLPLLSK